MTDYKLELRARVEALEAAQRPRVFTAEEVAPAVVPTVKESLTVDGSLVERVANAIYANSYDNGDEARAAIREVAAWLGDLLRQAKPQTAIMYPDYEGSLQSGVGFVITRLYSEVGPALSQED